jgi:hypothetical protein
MIQKIKISNRRGFQYLPPVRLRLLLLRDRLLLLNPYRRNNPLEVVLVQDSKDYRQF